MMPVQPEIISSVATVNWLGNKVAAEVSDREYEIGRKYCKGSYSPPLVWILDLDPLVESEAMGFWGMLWESEAGQDVAEYAVMLSVILMLALATVRLIGTEAGNSFSSIARKIQ